METFLNFLTVFGLGSVITVFITHKLKQSSESKIKMRELKENQYKSLLNNLMGFFEGWEDYAVADKKARKKQFLWEVYTSVPVYASDVVIRLCYEFIESHNKEGKLKGESNKIYSKIVIAMRMELNKIYGQPDTTLSEKDIKVLKVD
ncbi:hypothetical protein COW99_01550 [Candidatus Roizmanbacteria bacterium CG22_combo_CG10-13_8_21_14_all_38_20]|uniref:Uncharacterized protein n=1 Tax=Candidatus Roizmanbacteria bacterium CG22_combo_CG10-13_8_21_14_all_38_20 TaxID=1974862 RepID=A0A2H0BXY3_9BACT|nr:hypothetical protein [Candidatus Microgenomates bacterium]PIP61890.1 MAG: hypothetical protein COW99_01550 [Candidatus Roizmanbacteria bacterium CG22_combo_CG10-13_8_21_14_all_38_20]PJC32135.1 MAG: hypothetical protein CO050_01405 [Candidatus Roizmanbacteria bacterium CG_4_9_14_0_2_um_filter_38_17]